MLKQLQKLNRFEIIGPNGREYVRYLRPKETVKVDIQDDGETLKIFISKPIEKIKTKKTEQKEDILKHLFRSGRRT